MKTFANSLGWNLNPAMVTQRVAPRVVLPITRTTASRISVPMKMTGANVPSQL